MRTHSHELGERIKKLRLAQNLTLKQLETKARVSATHLSEIERGLTSPTVGAIARIARALGEEPALLVCEHAGPRVAVVTSAEPAWTSNGTSVRSLGSPLDGAEMSVLEVELAAGAEFAPRAGGSEEFVIVLAGAVELCLGASTHALAEGDAMHYPGSPARVLRARGTARVLCVSLPAVTL
jgi:transcriptional regulator with XRE-family HTH domain